MRTILSKKHQRALLLLEKIYEERFISIKQAASFLDISTKTLRMDIDSINIEISPISITLNASDELYLEIPLDYSIEYIYPAILSFSIEFNLIESLFLSEKHTIESLSEKLFISPSTTRRMIRSINNSLKEETIYINLKPLKIIGDEKKICNFIIHLISEKYQGQKSLFSRTQLFVIDQIFSYISKENQLILNYPDVERLKIWIMVCIIRIKHNNFIFPTDNFKPPFKLSSLNELVLKRLFKTVFKIELNNQVIFQIFFVFFNGQYAFNSKHLDEIAATSSEKQFLKMEIEKLIDTISSKLQIEHSNKENLLLELYNISNLQYGKPYILYDHYQMFVQNIKKNHIEFIDILISEVEAFFTKINLKNDSLNSYLYMIISHWKNLYLEIENRTPVLTIGLFYSTDIEHMTMMKDAIQFKFNNRFEIEILSDPIFKNFEKKARDKDLIITNIPGLANKELTVVCFPIYPKSSDWAKLHQFYEDHSFD